MTNKLCGNCEHFAPFDHDFFFPYPSPSAACDKGMCRLSMETPRFERQADIAVGDSSFVSFLVCHQDAGADCPTYRLSRKEIDHAAKY